MAETRPVEVSSPPQTFPPSLRRPPSASARCAACWRPSPTAISACSGSAPARSSIGTWTQLTAQNWMVLSLTGSAFYLGLDAFLQQLPIMLFTLIGGVLADRRDRRRTLLTSQYIQMATATTLALLVYLRRRPDLAHPAAVVHDRPRAGLRRSGLSGAHPVARRQERSAERGRAQLDSVQHRARARPARLRRDDRRLREVGIQRSAGDGRLLRSERAVVPGRHLGADVAAREAHSVDRRRQHARRDADRALLRAQSRQPGRAHRARGGDDVPRLCGADVPAALHADRLSRKAPKPTATCWRFPAPARSSARWSSRGSASSRGWG